MKSRSLLTLVVWGILALFIMKTCVGEGENALLELFVANKAADKFSIHYPIAGLCWKKDGNFIDHGFSALLENLDDIPV